MSTDPQYERDNGHACVVFSDYRIKVKYDNSVVIILVEIMQNRLRCMWIIQFKLFTMRNEL